MKLPAYIEVKKDVFISVESLLNNKYLYIDDLSRITDTRSRNKKIKAAAKKYYQVQQDIEMIKEQAGWK